MREAEKIIQTDLTKIPKPPYAKGGDIFMAENGAGDVGPKNPLENGQSRKGEQVKNPQEGAVNQGQEKQENAGQKRKQNPPTPEAGGVGKGDGGQGKEPSEKPGENIEAKEGDSAQGNTASEKQPNANADSLLQAITTPELKTIVARAATTSSREQLEKLYADLGEASGRALDRSFKERDTLINKRDSLLRMPAPTSQAEKMQLAAEKMQTEDALRQIDFALSKIMNEQDVIAKLLVQKAGPSREASSDETDIIEGTMKKYKELGTETDPTKIKILKKEIRDAVEKLYKTLPSAPENRDIPDDILKVIGRDEAMTEKFINRLIVSMNENDPYQMHGFYAAVNLDNFFKMNQDLPVERLDRLENLRQATQVFHNMNYIIKRSFDQFADQSKALLPKHFEVITQIPGAATVFRAYERLVKEELGTETRITEEALSRVEKDKVWGEKGIEVRIKEEFMKRMEDGKLRIKGFVKENGMEDWEINRAITYGRNLFRSSVRAGELISLSELHHDQEKFISAPQKELTQLMDPLKFTTFRFRPNELRGGPEIADKILEKRREARRRKGDVRIQTFEGVDTDNRGMQEILSVRGFLETWRLAHALMTEVKFMDGEKITNVMQFFKDHGKQIERFKDWRENEDAGWKREFKQFGQKEETLGAYKKRRVGELFKPLIENNNVALGVLVSRLGLTLSVPVELKELIWEKIPSLNPNAMAAFLTRLEVDDKADGAKDIKDISSLEQILARHFRTEEQQLILFQAKLEKGEDKTKISPEELKERTRKLLREEKQLEEEIEAEKDNKIKASLEERLKETRGNLQWKPLELKKEISKFEEEEKILKGKESRNHISDTEAERLRELTLILQDRKAEYEKLDLEVKTLLKNPEWTALKDKFEIINERRLQDETKRIMAMKENGKPDEPSKDFKDYLREAGVTEKEMDVYNSIVDNGQKIARDMANMKQVTVWFLDDAPLEIMKWTNLGQVYDRQTNDLAAFNKGSQKLMEFLLDPFSAPPAKIMELLREAMDGPGQVMGLDAAQDNMKEIVLQYLEMIKENGINNAVWWSMIKHELKKPTSRAQKITGSVESPATGVDGMFDIVQHALHVGTLRPETRNEHGKLLYKSTYDEAKEEFKLGWFNRIVKKNIYDAGPLFLIAFLIKFFQGTYSFKQR